MPALMCQYSVGGSEYTCHVALHTYILEARTVIVGLGHGVAAGARLLSADTFWLTDNFTLKALRTCSDHVSIKLRRSGRACDDAGMLCGERHWDGELAADSGQQE